MDRITLLQIGAGIVILFGALFEKKLSRLFGLGSPEEQFTVEKFRKSAEFNRKFLRIALALMGLNFLLRGIGPYFLPNETVLTIGWIVVGLIFLIILVVVGNNLKNWRR